MKSVFLIAALATTLTSCAFAEDEGPFADAVEMRHRLMLQMATDLGKVGAMATGDVA